MAPYLLNTGFLGSSRLPHVRIQGYLPTLAILALVFVIPHDSSTRMDPDKVGADGMLLVPTLPRRGGLSQQPSSAHLDDSDRRYVPVDVLWRKARITMHKLSPAELLAPPTPPPLPLPTQLAGACNFTTVEELREFYGPRQNWWGDFDARETRQLYHSLLPKQLLEESAALPVEDRARLAVAARRAARLYARERGPLPVTLACQLLDGVRVFAVSGNWQPDGLSEEQIFAKYATSCGGESEEEVYYKILQKSCTSNLHVDAAVGLAGAALEKGAAIGPFGL